jgi:hypothetical protein
MSMIASKPFIPVYSGEHYTLCRLSTVYISFTMKITLSLPGAAVGKSWNVDSNT